ncbi:hypothetical protein F2P81_004634 [Scophthalmus maximus]|uniref:Uncharacterized protein n=1 Tax=Scophthalmus maximus TaxID=52904 RepID=A0A6A4TA44_SCOMX|nr:hypothetical protein F2P81_004634 [Scophthalmus maximus]
MDQPETDLLPDHELRNIPTSKENLCLSNGQKAEHIDKSRAFTLALQKWERSEAPEFCGLFALSHSISSDVTKNSF